MCWTIVVVSLTVLLWIINYDIKNGISLQLYCDIPFMTGKPPVLSNSGERRPTSTSSTHVGSHRAIHKYPEIWCLSQTSQKKASVFSPSENIRKGWRPWRSWRSWFLCPCRFRGPLPPRPQWWRFVGMGHGEKRATLSTPKDMENHSRELWIVFQLVSSWYLCLQHGSPWTMRCQGRDARGPKTPGGRMRCRAAALRWWFCAKQNLPWLLRARYIMVLLFCWRSISVSQWIGFRDNLQENHGFPMFSLWNIGLCKFSLKPIHCLRLSSLLSGESAAKCKHWHATGWAGN